MYLLCGFSIFGRKGGLLAMPGMSKQRKQEWALFLNERNRITYNDFAENAVVNVSRVFAVLWCIPNSKKAA